MGRNFVSSRPPVAFKLAACALSFAAAFLLWSPTASADVKLGVELRGEFMRRFNVKPYGGPGLAVDLGFSFDTYPILVIPEICVEGAFYAPEIYTGSSRAVGGMRVGAALEVEPTVDSAYGTPTCSATRATAASPWWCIIRV